jgi:hypothetical protein
MRSQQCPSCLANTIEQTIMAFPMGLDRNRARCSTCGWTGYAYETKPIPSVETLVYEIRSLESRLVRLESGLRRDGIRLSVSCEGCGLWIDWPIRDRELASKFACNCDPPRQRVEFHRDGEGLVLVVEPFARTERKDGES